MNEHIIKYNLNIFTVDLEYWFHILNLPQTAYYFNESYKYYFDSSVDIILEMLNQTETKATFFVLGSVAEENPLIIKRIIGLGHEIASHGYSHELVYEQTPKIFYDDILKAKKVIEDITGKAVEGYRAPGFSITDKTPWAFDAIASAGYKYDSSVFPMRRRHGGLLTPYIYPHIISTQFGNLYEIPISTSKWLGLNYYCFGGGYFRITPYWLIDKLARKLNKNNRPVVSYLHPREFDGNHPRIKMNILRYFQSYINVGKSTNVKSCKMLKNFIFINCISYVKLIEHDKSILVRRIKDEI